MPRFFVTLVLATSALSLFAQRPDERAPRLVPWRGAQFFSGVVSPESTDAGMSFILDSALTTPAGANYYGVGIKLRTIAPATFRMVWRRTGQPDLPVELLGSTSCVPAPGTISPQSVLLSLSAREGRRMTGRESPGAGEGPARTKMDGGQPVFMYECEVDTVLTETERRIRVLIPEIRFQFGGRLVVTAIYPGPPLSPPAPPGVPDLRPPSPPIESGPLAIDFVRGRPRVLVVGDSVAWGQGVPNAQKVGFRIFSDMVQRYGGQTLSFATFAHSGARINKPGVDRIADVDESDCIFQRELDGEIPRAEPTVQCQLRDAITRECFVDTREIGVVPIPFFFCVDGLPRRTTRPNETRFNFDRGPTYDVAVMWGCINDVNTTDIVAGTASDAVLATRTASNCDLRNGLADLREALPNAKVIVNQYHRVVSELTDVARSGCGVVQARAILTGMSQAVLLERDTVRAAAARSTAFRDNSTTALKDSAASFAVPANERRGRGSVEFMDHPIFDPPGSAMWASATPFVFPLVCNSQGILAATDTVQTARIAECARVFNVSAADPFRFADADFMSCVRASAFHPNVTSNTLMADRIIANRQRFYPRMMNFNPAAPAMVNPAGEIP